MTSKPQKYDSVPFGKLLAAEADYLNVRGWVPFSAGQGRIVWKDPTSERRLSQYLAVSTQRWREPVGGGLKMETTEFPIATNFDIPDNHVTFIRDVLSVGEYHDYRVTVAYKVIGFEKVAASRDPAFIILAGLSFWHVQGPDTFTKAEGRAEAVRRLKGEPEFRGGDTVDNPKVLVQNTPIRVRVYVDQPVDAAVYKALAKLGRKGMEKVHVPTRLIGFFLRLAKKTPPKRKPRVQEPKRSVVSRNAFTKAYNEAIKAGKVEDDAKADGIVAARIAVGEAVTVKAVRVDD
jgi:hypothetical protein